MRNRRKIGCMLLIGILLLEGSGIYAYASVASGEAEDIDEEEIVEIDEASAYVPGEILVSYRTQASEDMIRFAQEMDGDVSDIVSETEGGRGSLL